MMTLKKVFHISVIKAKAALSFAFFFFLCVVGGALTLLYMAFEPLLEWLGVDE